VLAQRCRDTFAVERNSVPNRRGGAGASARGSAGGAPSAAPSAAPTAAGGSARAAGGKQRTGSALEADVVRSLEALWLRFP